MKTLLLKTTCHENHVHTTLAHPLAEPGDNRDASVQIRRIVNIPDDIPAHEVIRLFERTCDVTWLGGKPGRLEFDFSELGEGRIIR